LKEVWKHIEPEHLYFCYECSRCTGSCPAAMVLDTPGPRRILVSCLYSGPNAVTGEESLWYCTTCHVCEDRCPQELHIVELLTALMNVAAARGNIPDKIRAVTDKIARTGRSVITYRVDEERARFGLSPLAQINVEEVEALAARTGLFEKVKT